MARVQEYFESQRNLGPSAAVAYLDNWLSTRAGMNAALMEQEMRPGADPAKLAAQEAKVRDALGKLYRARADYHRAVATGDVKLKVQAMKSYSAERVAGINARARERVAQIGATYDYRALAQDVNRDITSGLADVGDPTRATVLEGLYRRYANTSGARGSRVAGEIGRDVASELSKAGAEEGSMLHGAMVKMAVDAANRAGDKEAAQAIAEQFGAEKGQSWDEHMKELHPFVTEGQVEGWTDDLEEGRVGSNAEGAIMLYQNLAGDEGATSIREGAGGAFTPGDMDEGIKDMEAAADSLAAARDAAMKRQSAGFRPRPNWMITNPNQYTDTRQLASLGAWGQLQPEYVEEVAAGLERNRGAIDPWRATRREIGERGGLSSEMPVEEGLSEGYEEANAYIDSLRGSLTGQELKQAINDYGANQGGEDARGRGVLLAVNAATEGLRDVVPERDTELRAGLKAGPAVTAEERGKAMVADTLRALEKEPEEEKISALWALLAAQGDTDFGRAVKSAASDEAVRRGGGAAFRLETAEKAGTDRPMSVTGGRQMDAASIVGALPAPGPARRLAGRGDAAATAREKIALEVEREREKEREEFDVDIDDFLGVAAPPSQPQLAVDDDYGDVSDDLLAFVREGEQRAAVVSDFYDPRMAAGRLLAPSPAEAAKTRKALEGVK